MIEFLVITGLSGAGRTQTANALEDLGWFVIDNLPVELIPKVAELAQAPGSATQRVALVVGTSNPTTGLEEALAALRAEGARVRIIFLEASTEMLVRRYETSRRRHPLLVTGEGLSDAIERERLALQGLRADADVVVDTTELNVHQLRDRIAGLIESPGDDRGMQVRVQSFGFKHGLPTDVDMVFDCRFLPNPHWVDDLRPLTGLDAPVREHVLAQAISGEFLSRLDDLFELLVPAYRQERKAYLTIAFGCTGGRHRSVVVAEEFAARLRAAGVDPAVHHRDVER